MVSRSVFSGIGGFGSNIISPLDFLGNFGYSLSGIPAFGAAGPPNEPRRATPIPKVTIDPDQDQYGHERQLRERMKALGRRDAQAGRPLFEIEDSNTGEPPSWQDVVRRDAQKEEYSRIAADPDYEPDVWYIDHWDIHHWGSKIPAGVAANTDQADARSALLERGQGDPDAQQTFWSDELPSETLAASRPDVQIGGGPSSFTEPTLSPTSRGSGSVDYWDASYLNPRTAATPSGAYTKDELDALQAAQDRAAEKEASKSIFEKLGDVVGLSSLTQDDRTPAFQGLDPERYNINQYDPLGAGGYQIAQDRGYTDPFSVALHATGAAPGIPGAFGPLSTGFMGITEAMAEARAVDRAREMYGLPTTKSYQRSYQPSPRGGIAAGIGQFFGLGTEPLFDEEELYDLDFAGHLGDVGAETLTYGDYSRATPDYSGTMGYDPGDRAWDRYTHHYTQALDEYNRDLGQALMAPPSPEYHGPSGRPWQLEPDPVVHPAYRQRELEGKTFEDSAWERGKWDFTLDPITYASGESTIGWTDPEDLNDPNKGLVDPVTGLMYTAALDPINPDFDKLLEVNERINEQRQQREDEREATLEKNQREALMQMEQTYDVPTVEAAKAAAAVEAQRAAVAQKEELDFWGSTWDDGSNGGDGGDGGDAGFGGEDSPW